jgi:hypothetical protein
MTFSIAMTFLALDLHPEQHVPQRSSDSTTILATNDSRTTTARPTALCPFPRKPEKFLF